MRTGQATRRFETNGTQQVHAAQIMSNASMFDIFYNKLYTRKEEAIIRELMANAWDAHIDAGTTDVPMKIHLPTILEPWFTLRDYGTGMESANLIWRYMNYGNSDKNEDDDHIGGLGLGGKSPFCYTDQFTVTSFYDGMKTVFQAFIQADGTPGCTELHSEPSDEHTGLEVQVNITDAGISHNRFLEAMRKLYPFVPTAPKMNVSTANNNFERIEYRLDLEVNKDPLKRVAIRNSRGVRSDLTIVMGIVPYTIPYDELEQSAKEAGISRDRMHEFRHLEFDLTVAIGAVQVTASREGLEYNRQTRQTLGNLIKDAYDIAEKEFAKALEGADTWFEWAQAATGLPTRPEMPPWMARTADQYWKVGFQQLGTDVKMAGSYAIAKKDSCLNDGFRREYFNALAAPRLDSVIVYAQPKAGWPVKRFLKEKHFTDGQVKDAMIVFGELDTIQKAFKKLGIPNKVHEMEYLKAAPGSSAAARKRLGKTKYLVRSLKRDINGNWTITRPQLSRETAQEFMDRLDQENSAVFINDYGMFPTVTTLLKSKAVLTDFDSIEGIEIQTNHSRVIEMVQEEFKDRIFNKDLLESDEFTVDYAVFQRAFDKTWVEWRINEGLNSVERLQHFNAAYLEYVEASGQHALSIIKRQLEKLAHINIDHPLSDSEVSAIKAINERLEDGITEPSPRIKKVLDGRIGVVKNAFHQLRKTNPKFGDQLHTEFHGHSRWYTGSAELGKLAIAALTHTATT